MDVELLLQYDVYVVSAVLIFGAVEKRRLSCLKVLGKSAYQ